MSTDATPRTEIVAWGTEEGEVVRADFARTLERELNRCRLALATKMSNDRTWSYEDVIRRDHAIALLRDLTKPTPEVLP